MCCSPWGHKELDTTELSELSWEKDPSKLVENPNSQYFQIQGIALDLKH